MNPVKSNHGQLSILRGQYCPKHISRTGCPGSWGHKPSIQYHCLPRHTFTGGGGSHKKRTIRSTSQKFLLCTRWYHFGSVSNKTKQLVLQVLTQGIPFFGWLRWLYHPAWVRNWYSENSCVKHLISLIHNQRLTHKGPTPLHSSVLKPLILPDSSASRTVSPTSELQQHLHLLLTVCSLVSRIPFTKQIKKSCSLNFFSWQFYISCSFAFFPRLIEAWPAKSFLTWKYFHIFTDILQLSFSVSF